MALHKVIKNLVLLLGLVAFGFFFYTLAVGDEAIELNENGVQSSTVTPMMYLSYIILGIIILSVVVFVLKGLFTSPETLKKSLISIGLLVVVVLISYFAFADNSVVNAQGEAIMLDDGEQLTASTSQWIGTSLYVFYILAIVAVGTIVWSGVSKVLKR